MLFKLSEDFIVNSDTEPWNVEGLRICIFGGAGSGKSWTAALLAEQFLSQGGTVVIFQPRAEYQTLRERFDVVVCGGPFAKDIDFVASSPATYARAVSEKGVSLIFYTTDVEDEEKLIDFTSKFMRYLLKYQETNKRPVLIILEEAQELIPKSPSGHIAPSWVYSRMIKAFKDGFLQGRKLNVVMVAISPRPQEVNFTARMLANISLYGKFSPQDISYIDRECLKWYRERGVNVSAKELLELHAGKFLAIYGTKARFITVTEPRLTSHGAVTPTLKFTAPRKDETENAVNELVETIKKALEVEKKEQSEIEKLKVQLKHVEQQLAEKEKEIEKLKTALEIASKIKIETPTKLVEVTPPRLEELEAALKQIHDICKGKLKNYSVTEAVSTDLWKTWENKLPTKCAKKIFKYLLDNKEAKFTKSQLAILLGYSSRSGTFNGAISFLKNNSLIQTDGKFIWIAKP